MFRGGRAALEGLDWGGRKPSTFYSDTKLFASTLAMGFARRWPEVVSSAADPGWVSTRMAGPGAPDDLRLGHLIQEWLATSQDPEASFTGGNWYHQQWLEPHAAASNVAFQSRLLEGLGRATEIPLPRP